MRGKRDARGPIQPDTYIKFPYKVYRKTFISSISSGFTPAVKYEEQMGVYDMGFKITVYRGQI
jgi:hypothetical protein